MTDDARQPAESAVVASRPTAHGWRPDRFMVIVAHPDDADFGPAASAASWIDQGSHGWLVCCTSGDAGCGNPLTVYVRHGGKGLEVVGIDR